MGFKKIQGLESQHFDARAGATGPALEIRINRLVLYHLL
jgi:hypothetical protein